MILAAGTFGRRIVRDEIDQRLVLAATDRQALLQMYVRQQQERIALVASRTRLRQLVDNYAAGKTPADEFRQQSAQILADARRSAEGFLAISIANLQGIVITTTDEASLSKDYGADPDFLEGRRDSHLGVPRRSGDTYQALLTAPVVNTDGRLRGVAIVSLDVTPMVGFLAGRTGLGESGEILVGTLQGAKIHLLLPARHDQQFTELPPGSMPIMEDAIRGRAGLAHTRDYRGVDVLAAYRPVGYRDWGLVAKIDAAKAYAPLARFNALVIILELCIFLAGLALASLQSRRFTKPILDAAQEDLRESEQRFRLMFASNPLPMWVYDLQTLQFLEVNEAAVGHYGYSHQEFLAMQITDIRPPEDVPRLMEDLAKDRPPLQHSGEWRHRRRDGAIIDVQIASHRFALESRDVVLVVAHDITDRKRAEQALRRSEEQLSLVYEHTSDVVFYLAVEPDEHYRFLTVNPAFVQATGLAESQVVGKLVQEVIPKPAHELVLSRYREAIRDSKTVHWEEVSVYPTGTKYGEVAVTPVFDASGRCTNLVGTVHDVTERRQAEEEIRRLNAELEARVIERTAQLEAANQELEAFSYSVAHDLRAPLRAMDGFSRMVVEDFASHLPEEGQRYLHLIRDNAQQMGHLIDDLLTFSRLGRQAVNRQQVHTASLVRQVIGDLQQEYEGREVTFAVGELPDCSADPALLKQVFANLVSNALKFTRRRDEPRIEVSSHMDGGQPVYSVKDNGVGFDMQYADKLFGVFQRLHRAEEYEGTGVGLAIVQRIVHRHGGRTWADAEVDKGATFHFTLGGVST